MSWGDTKTGIFFREWAGENTKNGQVPANSTYYLSKENGRWWTRDGYHPHITLFPDGYGEIDYEAQETFRLGLTPVIGPSVFEVHLPKEPDDPPQGEASLPRGHKPR